MSARSTVRSLSALGLVAALLLAGCGDGSEDQGGEPVTTPTIPADTATVTVPVEPPQTITEPVAPPATQTATAPAPATTPSEDEPGGAGDEEGNRVTAHFTLGAGGALAPDAAQVPAFLNVAVVVDNGDSASHRLEVGGRGAALPAGRTTTLTLPGRAAGDLPILVDGRQAGLLRVVTPTP